MSSKNYRKVNQRTRKTERDQFFQNSREYLLKEKGKARDLRKSSWWRKKRSSGICYYCGRKYHPDELTMDHKIPLSRGGASKKFNIVPACKECNNNKKCLIPAEWDDYLNSLR